MPCHESGCARPKVLGGGRSANFKAFGREGFDFYQPTVAGIPMTATTAVCVYHFLLYNWRQYMYIQLGRQGIPQEISWGRSKVLSALESIPE